MTKLFAFRHLSCGGTAFYFVRKPKKGEYLRAEDIVFLDGTKPSIGDLAVCGTCHEYVGTHEMLADCIEEAQEDARE